MKYVITKPSVWMYLTEDLTGEVSDELLFGTVIEILSENGSTAYVRTDYGYCGYISLWDINECTDGKCEERDTAIVYSRCDLLTECSYRLRPYMTLPRGSRVKISTPLDGRFSECLVGRKRLYIPNYAICPPTFATLADGISAAALSYLGVPYRWGGRSDIGIDCSGLAFMSCRLCGAELYRDSVPDKRYVYEIDESEARSGDLAYFEGHVAIMTGSDSYVHASASACRVVAGAFDGTGLDKKSVVCFARVRENG